MKNHWIVEVQRVDTSGDYARLEHVERREFTDILEHDKYVGQVKQQYAEQDDVQIVGNDHTEYKPTRLGKYHIF